MRILFYFLLVLLAGSVAINLYAFFNKGFFRSPLSILINSLTPVVALVYLITIAIKKKRLKTRLHGEYEKFFNKN